MQKAVEFSRFRFHRRRTASASTSLLGACGQRVFRSDACFCTEELTHETAECLPRSNSNDKCRDHTAIAQ